MEYQFISGYYFNTSHYMCTSINLKFEKENRLSCWCNVQSMFKSFIHNSFFLFFFQWFQREARVQVHANAQTISFWLLKYDVRIQRFSN